MNSINNVAESLEKANPKERIKVPENEMEEDMSESRYDLDESETDMKVTIKGANFANKAPSIPKLFNKVDFFEPKVRMKFKSEKGNSFAKMFNFGGLTTPDHVKLNHLLGDSSSKDCQGNQKKRKSCFGVSMRYRAKYTTFLFYTSNSL